MAAVQLEEAGLHHLLRHILAIDADRRAFGTDCIQHDFNQLVHPVNVVVGVLGKNVDLKIFPNKLFITLSFVNHIHPVRIDRLILTQRVISFLSNYLISIYSCRVFLVWLIHIWIIHIGLFHVWIIRVWKIGLRLFIYLKDHAAHPAFIVPLSVSDEVPIFLKLFQRREDGIGSFLADRRQASG